MADWNTVLSLSSEALRTQTRYLTHLLQGTASINHYDVSGAGMSDSPTVCFLWHDESHYPDVVTVTLSQLEPAGDTAITEISIFTIHVHCKILYTTLRNVQNNWCYIRYPH